MGNRELRESLIEAARRIDRRNLQTNNGGNFSARCGDNMMLVKPSDVSFLQAMPEGLVYTNFNGLAVFEGLKPSKESILHGLIYENFPQIGAIMHCHSPWATAWAESMLPLDLATYHSHLKLGDAVPVFDTESYAVPYEKADLIIRELKSKYSDSKAFLLRRHGVMSLGKDIHEAVNIAESIEETATIAMLSRMCRTAK
jgi:L-ribulose-5-phosphate 4-epimerase